MSWHVAKVCKEMIYELLLIDKLLYYSNIIVCSFLPIIKLGSPER